MIRSHQKWDYRYRDHPSLFLMLFPGFIFVCLHSSVCSGTWFVLKIVKRDMWRTGTGNVYGFTLTLSDAFKNSTRVEASSGSSSTGFLK